MLSWVDAAYQYWNCLGLVVLLTTYKLMYCTLLCWKEHSNTMPMLSQTAQVYLGISRPCRMAWLILNGKRSFLRPDKRNKLVFIRASFHIVAGSCPSVTAGLTLALPRRQWRQHHPNWHWQDQKHQSINQSINQLTNMLWKVFICLTVIWSL